MNHMLVTQLLRRWGHTLVSAPSRQDAVDLFLDQTWDLILVDMHIPVMADFLAKPFDVAVLRSMLKQPTPERPESNNPGC